AHLLARLPKVAGFLCKRYGEVARFFRELHAKPLPPAQAVRFDIRHGPLRLYRLAERLGGFPHTLQGVLRVCPWRADALVVYYDGVLHSVPRLNKLVYVFGLAVDVAPVAALSAPLHLACCAP